MEPRGVASSAPFWTTRSLPPCSATKRRPSGAGASAVALVSPPIQPSLRVNPAGMGTLPPKRTVALDHGETLPAASVARARTTCCPDGYAAVSSEVVYGAVATGLPSGAPSIWNSTPVTPTSSAAVAPSVMVPVRPLASGAGDVSVAVGATVSDGPLPIGDVAEPPP